jgi:hypothetical protein
MLGLDLTGWECVALVVVLVGLASIAFMGRTDNSPNWGNSGVFPIGCGIIILVMIVVAVIYTAEHWGLNGCDDTTWICSMLRNFRGR